MMCFIFLMSMLTYTLFYDSQPDPKSPAIEQTWGCFQDQFFYENFVNIQLESSLNHSDWIERKSTNQFYEFEKVRSSNWSISIKDKKTHEKATLASLFMVVTCDGWYEIQASLEIQFEGQYSMIIMSRFVMIFIVLIGHFVIFNIFVGS